MARLGRGRPIQPKFVKRAINPESVAHPSGVKAGELTQAAGTHAGTSRATILSGALIRAAGSKSVSGSASVPAGALMAPRGVPGAPGSTLSGALIRAAGTRATSGSATVLAAALAAPKGGKLSYGSAVIRTSALAVPAGTHQAAGAGVIRAGARVAAAGSKNAHGGGTIKAGVFNVVAAAPVRIANSWVASYTAPVVASEAFAVAAQSIPVQVANTAGNWLFAVCAWRQAPGYPPVTFSVGDGTNVWEPMGAPSGTSPADGSLRISVWRAPAARAVATVAAAPTGFCLSAAVAVIEFEGLQPWITEAGTVTAFAASATSLPSLSTGSSSVPVLWFTAMARGLNSPHATYPSGWLVGPATATGNEADHTSDLVLLTALQQSGTTVSATWSQSAASDMVGIICGVQVFSAALDQPNLQWAPGVFELAVGAGVTTPPDELTWVAVDDQTVDGLTVPVRVQDLSFTQGQQYTVGSLQSGQGSVTIDNRDLAVLPPGTGPFTGIDSGTPWRYRITWPGGQGTPANPTPHYVIQGFTLDLPATWAQDTRRGIITTGLTDAWAFCQPQIQSSLRMEMLSDGPAHLWPCGDAAGITYASNIAPGSTAVLAQVTSKYGNAGATAAFGGTASLSPVQAAISSAGTGGLPGDGGTVWQQSGLPTGATPGGFCLFCQSPDFPALDGTAGYTIECWAALLDPAPLQQPGTVWAIKGSKGLVMRCWADTTGALWLTTQDIAGNQVTTTLGTTSYAAAGMFQTAVVWNAATGWTVYVNGAAAAQSASVPDLPPSYAWVSAGGESDRFTSGAAFDGQIAFLADYPVALTAARISAHFQAGNTAFQSEPDYTRIERLLGYAGYTGRRVIRQSQPADLCASLADLGTTTASGGTGVPTPAGQGTVQAGQEMTSLVASLTPAMLYVSGTGDICWQPKGLQYGQPAVWVLDDDDDNDGIPYQPDVSFGWDPQRVLNLVQITQVDRQDVIGPQAFVPLAEGYILPAQSQNKYGQQTYQITGYLFNDLTTPIQSGNPSNLLDLANWISVTLAAPHLRAGKVTVDASSYPGAWPLVAGAAVGDMVLIGRAPVTASASISLLARLMRIERQVTFGAGKTKAPADLTLDYCPEGAPWVLDDPVRGQLTGTNVLTW